MTLSSRRGRSWLLGIAVTLLVVAFVLLAVPSGLPMRAALDRAVTGLSLAVAGAILLAAWLRSRP